MQRTLHAASDALPLPRPRCSQHRLVHCCSGALPPLGNHWCAATTAAANTAPPIPANQEVPLTTSLSAVAVPISFLRMAGTSPPPAASPFTL
jgi:hypothetical protein